MGIFSTIIDKVQQFLFLAVVHAQTTPAPATSPTDIQKNLNGEFSSNNFIQLNPVQGNLTIGNLVDVVISFILYGAGILAIIYLLYAGVMYITAAGDETKAVKARTGIVNAVIGIIIILLAFVIEKAVARVFGVSPSSPSNPLGGRS